MRNHTKQLPDLHRLLRVWLASALVLLTVSSLSLSKSQAGSDVLGYVSSAVSFLSAVCAGLALGRGSGSGAVSQGLLLALLLSIILLTIGFFASQKELSPSGILSAVSFTAAGSVLGQFLSGGNKRSRSGGFRARRKP